MKPFLAAATVLTGLALAVVWRPAFLGLQDYPAHLLIAHIAESFDDPAMAWDASYTSDLSVGPYSAFYLIVTKLARFMSVDAAGRAFLSLCIILTLVAVLLPPLGRRRRGGSILGGSAAAGREEATEGSSGTDLEGEMEGSSLPWAALIVLPFVFNPMFYFGFVNFQLALPLILLALRAHGGWALGRGSLRHGALNGLWLLCLFLAHPYGIAVYIPLAATASFLMWRSRELRRPAAHLSPLAAAAALLGYLSLAGGGEQTAAALTVADQRWMPPTFWVGFALLNFTGMTLFNGVRWLELATWMAVALLLGAAVRRSGILPRAPGDHSGTLLLLTLLGYAILPFWVGKYAYFNLRLISVALLLGALVLRRVRTSPRVGVALASLFAVQLAAAGQRQNVIGAEVAEVADLVQELPPGKRMVPVIFSGGSAVLDEVFIHEVHSHDHNYYNLLGGGGANPGLFDSPMLPVQYRGDVALPFPRDAMEFSWEGHGSAYDLILVRGGDEEFFDYVVGNGARLVAGSGEWRAFENPASSLPGGGSP
jgi:hypothetical protein